MSSSSCVLPSDFLVITHYSSVVYSVINNCHHSRSLTENITRIAKIYIYFKFLLLTHNVIPLRLSFLKFDTKNLNRLVRMAQIPECPESLKKIQHHLKIALEHDSKDPVISYWCELFDI